MKDFLTKQILLRCNSTSELYLITPTVVALLSTSTSLWHQRLGHPGPHVQSLISSQFISCNKYNVSLSCNACHLGKHTRLPFVLSNNYATELFEIIHSDLWTSPVLSTTGIKYYIIFLNNYSHFLWVYPLCNKSDVFGNFLHFCTYVKTQFKCEIKSFQCDHGGEFDNHQFHFLFDQNGIQFRFPYPHTSQQNGRS